ncbi:MAG: hypothetical protein E4H20_06345 [Spirochaetales bacterium]|nr:MAG: hypothetical protein E4H20_06345 [Spirochaetales bacterium]
MGELLKTAPNCLTCEYFYVTWDIGFPRGCRIFDIKCRILPSHEVFTATGVHCPSYVRKPGLS